MGLTEASVTKKGIGSTLFISRDEKLRLVFLFSAKLENIRLTDFLIKLRHFFYFIYLFLFLFIQYFRRVTHLAVIAILPCGPLCKHIYISTNTKVI